MSGYEALAAGYFVALAFAAFVAPALPARRRRAVLASLGMAATVFAIGHHGSDVVRAWLPHLYLAAGYWVPAFLTTSPPHPTAFESWLRRTDAVLRPSTDGVPSPVVHALEIAYLGCYPLVPAALIAVSVLGGPGDVERFWTAVLLAGYACYASLPWLVSRPPRLVDGAGRPATRVAALNAAVLGRVSHQLNTFPSGHVAVALACAASVAAVSTSLGAAFGVAAAGVALGAAAGRYHYVIDVMLGVIAGAAAVALATT